jgi:hypothetical protein
MANKIFYEGLIEQATLSSSSTTGTPNAVLTVAPDRQYYNTFVTIDANNWVDSECAEIAFLNVGDGNFPTPTGQNVTILGFTIKPGFGISFDGNENEIDMTKYQISFTGTGVKNCWVFRKMYR